MFAEILYHERSTRVGYLNSGSSTRLLIPREYTQESASEQAEHKYIKEGRLFIPQS